MRDYNNREPLIFIHVPKCGGTSVKKQFKAWFGKSMHEHYFNEISGLPPKKIRLRGWRWDRNPIIIYGHFNRYRNFGIEDYYPDVDQFVTVLRDPFETAVSGYYYLKNASSKWKDQSRVPKSEIQTHLLESDINYLNHFPVEITKLNYKEVIEKYFIAVGITEHLDSSLHLIGKKLGLPCSFKEAPHLNQTARDTDYSFELRGQFKDRFPLEFEVYNYCLSRFNEQLIEE